MRTTTIALLAFLLLPGCRNSGDDDTSSSSSSGGEQCTEGFEGGPDVDPNFPACGCLPQRCEGEAGCIPTGFPEWTSSVCAPKCATDMDCPTLSGMPTTCSPAGFCRLACDNGNDCPASYVCGEGGECQVDLTKD